MTVQTPDILDCQEFKKFWLSWEEGLIRLGHGLATGVDSIIQWQDPNPYIIKGVAISTGYGATGKWDFSQIEGRSNPLMWDDELPTDLLQMIHISWNQIQT